MDSVMTEKEVTKIIENRQERFLARRAREIKKLEKKLEDELKSWQHLRELGEGEVDVTDISQARPNFSDPI
jgi:flagellar motility protein MotE (MotC chaperone)